MVLNRQTIVYKKRVKNTNIERRTKESSKKVKHKKNQIEIRLNSIYFPLQISQIYNLNGNYIARDCSPCSSSLSPSSTDVLSEWQARDEITVDLMMFSFFLSTGKGGIV